jgi:hypothetical protein
MIRLPKRGVVQRSRLWECWESVCCGGDGCGQVRAAATRLPSAPLLALHNPLPGAVPL